MLNERRDASERIAVIEAELQRIGEVTIFFVSTTDDDGEVSVTEEREGLSVTPGSSLAKLLQAYIAAGGNPFDISLFLTPDQTVVLDPSTGPADGTPTQPYQGVIAPKSGVYSSGSEYEGGYLMLKKYLPARMGGRKEVEDQRVGSRVDFGRRWVNKEIKTKRHNIEQRIIKLMDLREQLGQELDAITAAMGGIDASTPNFDAERFDIDLTTSSIAESIDRVFYVMDETNTPDFDEPNEENLADYDFLLSNIEPEEDNTAL
jgi:hypothetical protein